MNNDKTNLIAEAQKKLPSIDEAPSKFIKIPVKNKLVVFENQNGNWKFIHFEPLFI